MLCSGLWASRVSATNHKFAHFKPFPSPCRLDQLPDEIHIEILSYIESWRSQVFCMHAYPRWRSILSDAKFTHLRYELENIPGYHHIFTSYCLRTITCIISDGKIVSAKVVVRHADAGHYADCIDIEERKLWDVQLVGPGVLDDQLFLKRDVRREKNAQSLVEIDGIRLDFSRYDPECVFGKPCGYDEWTFKKRPETERWTIREFIEYSAGILGSDAYFQGCRRMKLEFRSNGDTQAFMSYFGGTAERLD